MSTKRGITRRRYGWGAESHGLGTNNRPPAGSRSPTMPWLRPPPRALKRGGRVEPRADARTRLDPCGLPTSVSSLRPSQKATAQPSSPSSSRTPELGALHPSKTSLTSAFSSSCSRKTPVQSARPVTRSGFERRRLIRSFDIPPGGRAATQHSKHLTGTSQWMSHPIVVCVDCPIGVVDPGILIAGLVLNLVELRA